MSQRSHNEDGFTFLEILVALVIVGVLAAIALPIYLKQHDSAKDANAKAAARNLVSQVEACHADSEDAAPATPSPSSARPG
jgi:prepilin-type N-terminal cleavage/methylation domain-containing protein